MEFKTYENGELTEDEIKKCEKNEKKSLQIKISDIPLPQSKLKELIYPSIQKS